jgi:hypothetical protein
MSTIIFWCAIVVFGVVVYKKTLKMACNNFTKPSHYFIGEFYFCCIFLATVVIFSVYLGVAFLLDSTGIASQWNVSTGIDTLSDFIKETR